MRENSSVYDNVPEPSISRQIVSVSSSSTHHNHHHQSNNNRSRFWRSFRQITLVVYEKTHDLESVSTSRFFILKLIWLISLLLAIALSIYWVIETIVLYYRFEVSTEIRDVYQDRIPLPVITICNANPMGTPSANRYIQEYYLKNYNVSINTADEFLALINNGSIENDNDYIFYTTYDPNFNQSLRENFTYNGLLACLNDIDCDINDLENYYDSTYGNCQRFNTGRKKHPLRTVNSKNDNLRIIVFIGPSTDQTNLYNSWATGLLVSIHDQNDYPISLQKGIAVKPGTMAQIDIKKTWVSQKPVPYSKCQVKDSVNTVLSREMARINMPYSRSNCFILCLQKQIIEEVGCYDMRYPRIFDAQPCANLSSYIELSEMSFFNSRCSELCPHECEMISFDATVSYFDFPTYLMYRTIVLNKGNLESIFRLFKDEEITFETFAKSFAGVNIYFNEIKVTEMRESAAMTFVELISNIGGTIGLFIEFTLLGCVEFIELVIEAAIEATRDTR